MDDTWDRRQTQGDLENQSPKGWLQLRLHVDLPYYIKETLYVTTAHIPLSPNTERWEFERSQRKNVRRKLDYQDICEELADLKFCPLKTLRKKLLIQLA